MEAVQGFGSAASDRDSEDAGTHALQVTRDEVSRLLVGRERVQVVLQQLVELIPEVGER